MNVVSHLLARPMLSGFGGGISRHTEGISMSRPPGPVTSHLLRWELSFRMPSFPLRILFWKAGEKTKTKNAIKHDLLGLCVLSAWEGGGCLPGLV